MDFLCIIEEPQILYLNDIFMYSNMDNYDEQIFISEYEPDELTIESKSNTYIEEMPKYYINKKIWIKHTTLLCTSCGRKINNIPLTIILKTIKTPVFIHGEKITLIPNFPSNNNNINNIYDVTKHDSKTVGMVHGLFCKITCIGWYINNIKDEKIKNKWEITELTLKFYEEISGIKLTDIPESINYIKLSSRSGTSGISDDDFDYLNERKIIMYTINE